MGLVDRVCPSEEFWPKVVATAEQIAQHPLSALSATKRLINAAEDTDLRTGCLLEREAATYLNSPFR